MKRAIFIIFFAALVGSIEASNVKPSIIGGEFARIQDFPYQASLRSRDVHICGGTIISERHILTSAFCITDSMGVFDPPYTNATVVTGTSLSFQGAGHVHRIAKVKIHPFWFDHESLKNDVAVITLKYDIHFNTMQKMVKLASREFADDTIASFTGWGYRLVASQTPSIRLQKLNMTLLNYHSCQPRIHVEIFDKLQFCGVNSNGHGGCVGDSGGPLVVDNQVIGIASWVIIEECGDGAPEIYTSVYAYRDFIESAMKE